MFTLLCLTAAETIGVIEASATVITAVGVAATGIAAIVKAAKD